MEVVIKGAVKQMRVSTITLQPEEGNNMYSFHCISCGNFHQQIGGKVSKIYPIHEPSDQVPVVSTCRNCGHKYTFQTFNGYDEKRIKVVLHAEKPYNMFYCYKGKNRILDYTAQKVFTTFERQVKKPPFEKKCPDSECGTLYFFQDLV